MSLIIKNDDDYDDEKIPLLSNVNLQLVELTFENILQDIYSKKLLLEAQLDTLMSIKTNKFCFLQCLHLDDQHIFKKKYIKYFNYCITNGNNSLYNALCEGGIQLKDWDFLMKKCSNLFNKQYFVYRQSYLGEPSGKVTINSNKVNHWSKVRIFGNFDRKAINLLVNNNSIKVSDIVRESSFVNMELVYWNFNDIIY